MLVRENNSSEHGANPEPDEGETVPTARPSGNAATEQERDSEQSFAPTSAVRRVVCGPGSNGSHRDTTGNEAGADAIGQQDTPLRGDPIPPTSRAWTSPSPGPLA